MTPQSLDTFLRTLTRHELAYKDGFSLTSFPDYPLVMKSGQMVMKSIFSRTPEIFIKSPYICIKKHSRFQAYPPHFHDWVELNYMYSGECRQIINNKSYKIEQGQVLLIDSDTVHTIIPLGENDILINIIINKTYFNSNFFNRLDSDSPLASFFINSITEGAAHDSFILFHSENSRRLPIFMNEFFCEWYNPSIRSSEMMNNLFSLIVTELIDVYQDDFEKTFSHSKKNSIIPVLRFIEGNYRTCTLHSTAQFFNMNANYLSSQLKKYTKKSFIEILHQQKIRSAKTLLRNSNMSVTEIANYIGYENVSFFYKKFREQCGCLPGEYRKCEE